MDDGVVADDDAGVEDGIAADLSPVSDDRSYLDHPCFDVAFRQMEDDGLPVRADVGCDGTRSKMRSVSKDAVSDVGDLLSILSHIAVSLRMELLLTQDS